MGHLGLNSVTRIPFLTRVRTENGRLSSVKLQIGKNDGAGSRPQTSPRLFIYVLLSAVSHIHKQQVSTTSLYPSLSCQPDIVKLAVEDMQIRAQKLEM